MKLLFCMTCQQIRRIERDIVTTCACPPRKAVRAVYVDRLRVEWNGRGHLLAIHNIDFSLALTAQHKEGDPEDGMGRRFEAWVIPDCAPSVRRVHTVRARKRS